jgi:competence protein ComEA
VIPGVHHLEAGARVVDAVDAAGGLAPDADAARLNLAALLVDGQQVYVARVGEAPPLAAPAGGTAAAGPAPPAPLVDLNTASATELEELPGIGPTTAEAIVDHRERNGPFAAVDDLLDVRGIGDAKLEQLRDRVTV